MATKKIDECEQLQAELKTLVDIYSAIDMGEQSIKEIESNGNAYPIELYKNKITNVTSEKEIKNKYLSDCTDIIKFKEKPTFYGREPNKRNYYWGMAITFIIALVFDALSLVQIFKYNNYKAQMALIIISFVLIFVSILFPTLFYKIACNKYYKNVSSHASYINNWEKEYKEERNKYIINTYGAEINEKVLVYKNAIKCKDNKLKDLKQSVSSLKKNLEDFQKVSIIPYFYSSNPYAVNKMFIIMVSKRASTLKELTNAYETDKFREETLDQLKQINKNLLSINNDLINHITNATKFLATKIDYNFDTLNSNISHLSDIVAAPTFTYGCIL